MIGEYEMFHAEIRKNGDVSYITLPAKLIKALGWEERDMIKVMVKKLESVKNESNINSKEGDANEDKNNKNEIKEQEN